MSPIPPYNPRRRLWMTLGLWGLLGLSLAAAGAVTYWRNHHTGFPLREAIDYGPVQVRLPQGWEIESRIEGQSQKLIALEPGGNGRRLTITTLQTRRRHRPDELLEALEILPPGEFAQGLRPFDVAGGEGVLVQLVRPRQRGDGSPKELTLACITYPDGSGAIIRLVGTGGRDEVATVLRVAQSLKLDAGSV